MLHISDIDRSLVYPSGNVTKKQYIGERVVSVKPLYDDKEEDGIGKRGTNKKTTEMRLEANRQRAKDTRKRKKIMTENMRTQLVCLSTEIKRLRIENKLQQDELCLLRKAVRLFTANNGSMTPHTIAPPTGLSNSKVPNSISGVGSTDARTFDLLLASIHSGNIGSINNCISDHLTTPRHSGNLGSTENQLSEILTAPRHSGDIRSSNNRVSAFLASPRYSGNTGGTDNRTNIGSSFASRDYNALPFSVADIRHQTLQRHSSSYGN